MAKWGFRSLVVARDRSCQLCERTRDLSSSGQGGQPVLLGPSGLEEHIAWSDCTNLVRPKHKTDSKQKTTNEPKMRRSPSVNEPSLGGEGGSIPSPHTNECRNKNRKFLKLNPNQGSLGSLCQTRVMLSLSAHYQKYTNAGCTQPVLCECAKILPIDTTGICAQIPNAPAFSGSSY